MVSSVVFENEPVPVTTNTGNGQARKYPLVDRRAERRYPPVRENKERDAMTNAKSLLSDDMLHKVEEAAREQSREPSEVVEEALGRYFASQRLETLGAKLEKHARSKGIREEDVPGLVQEVRRENADRGR
jgi:hypothetical protein